MDENRPPADRAKDATGRDPAIARYYLITAMRVLGAALVVLGMMAMQGVLDWGKQLGQALAVGGIAVFFVVPLLLARAWRTPK